MMKFTELQQYLGMPPQNIDFDKFLPAHNISGRPKFRESPVESIDLPEKGISLVFKESSAFKNTGGRRRKMAK
ncbi:hypothetical protein [Arthrobacter sp.]|uniref:hypothetical protein n=1 Tax=Arthrobacter sp. TaxID=1667 RepID=UPI002810A330|nr:hypothetical protein [Arthrobacter sp.]